jgi:hypothetical protein
MPGPGRLDAYVASLAGGLDAHSECQAKGILIRMLLWEELGPSSAARLPRPLRGLAEEVPMVSEWVPEVHHLAMLHALAEQSAGSEGAFLARFRDRYRRVYGSPTYRTLMAGQSPASLVRAAEGRWATFHRGSRLEVEGIGDDGVQVTLHFPAGLFDGFHLLVIRESFLAALDLFQARSPRVDLIAQGPEHGRFRLAWE